MKKTALTMVLLALVILEIYLCAAFLPSSWQVSIVQFFSHLWPKTFDYSVVTHPALDYEIENMFRNHTELRVALYAVILSVMVGNGFVMARIWKLLVAPLRNSGARTKQE